MFLSVEAGDGKSFFSIVISEYLRGVLVYPNQSLVQPYVLVTAPTAKAATGCILHVVSQLSRGKYKEKEIHA